jgi:hypothetical protein
VNPPVTPVDPPVTPVDPPVQPTAGCGLNSGHPGDELCLVPPSPEEGIQLHVGPADYDDPAALAPFMINPGEENVKCYASPVTQNNFYYIRQQNRMRPGSHHMLIGLQAGDASSIVPGSTCDTLASLGAVPGSQTPSRDFPPELAPEDAGLARYVPANAGVAAFQLHYVNTGDQPQMREAWINLYKMPNEEATQKLQQIFLVGDFTVNVPAHTTQTTTLSYTPRITEKTRIFTLSAHSHAHTETFTVWRVHAGQEQLLYKSFDWAEPTGAIYNTTTNIPAPNEATKTDGGATGLQYLEPGDSLKWACLVNNTTNASLRFANEAYTAEMCLLPGDYVGNTAGLMSGGCAAGSCAAGLVR